MNITELNDDAKYELAKNLSGEDLIRLCASDSNMRLLCSSSLYNSIWRRKLSQDYKINYQGSNAYMEYLQYTYFYKGTYWFVVINDQEEILTTQVEAFTSRTDAINYIFDQVLYYTENNQNNQDNQDNQNEEIERWTYPRVKAEIDVQGMIRLNVNVEIHLVDGKFRTTKGKNYEQIFHVKLNEIATIAAPKNTEKFIYDFDLALEYSTGGFNYDNFKRELLDIIDNEYPVNLDKVNNKMRKLLTDPTFL